jgi:HD superfamily phosphodiesterase
MDRLERVRQEVDSALLGLTSDEDRRFGFVHLYGVSLCATWLAARRLLDPELAAVAGMLHDITTYTLGNSADHAKRSAEAAAALLGRSDLFSDEEIAIVAHAIAQHSKKDAIDGPMDELLKDADVVAHWLYNPTLPPHPTHAARRERLERELAPRGDPT